MAEAEASMTRAVRQHDFAQFPCRRAVPGRRHLPDVRAARRIQHAAHGQQHGQQLQGAAAVQVGGGRRLAQRMAGHVARHAVQLAFECLQALPREVMLRVLGAPASTIGLVRVAGVVGPQASHPPGGLPDDGLVDGGVIVVPLSERSVDMRKVS
jgi:hypothetical protein